MAAKENRRVVRRYNRLAETLLHAEAVWHARWQAAIPALDGALAAPLLLRDGARVAVNLDRSVLEVVREARHMRRLGLEVPNPMPAILLQQDRLQRSYKRIALALQVSQAVIKNCFCVCALGRWVRESYIQGPGEGPPMPLSCARAGGGHAISKCTALGR